MNKKAIVLLVALLSINFLLAENPSINVQGVLRDSNGKAVNGFKDFYFTFYDSDGILIQGWDQTNNSLEVVNGIYNVTLTGFDGLPFNTTYFLQVEVEGEEMQDRIPLSMSPYSLSVQGVDNVFPSDGNVGIGTVNPDTDLTVYSEADQEGLTLQTSDNDFSQGLRFQNSGGNYTWNIFRDGSGGTDPDLVFASGSETEITDLVKRITFKNDGKVGIGTSNPSKKLHVNGDIKCDELEADGTITANKFHSNHFWNDMDVTIDAEGGDVLLKSNGNVLFRGNADNSVTMGKTGASTTINGKVSMFGSRSEITPHNYVSCAPSDGIVTAYFEYDHCGNPDVEAKIGSSNPPDITIARTRQDQEDGYGYATVTFPVKKGQYWKIIAHGYTTGEYRISYTRFGN